MSDALPPFAAIALTGLLTGLSLILPIGAQNAYVLKMGLLRQHVAWVAATCAFIDSLLIAIGCAFMAQVRQWLTDWPMGLLAIQWFGVVFLVAYGLRSFWSAYQTSQGQRTMGSDAAQTPTLRRNAILTVMALSLLNPHVYLDTVLLLGSISSQYGAAQWWFAAGAMTGSWLWFFALGFGARLLTPWFAAQRTWVILDALIGVVMLAVAYQISQLRL